MLVVKEQCQCFNPDESVLRRTEVLFCGWVHKFTLESGGRSEDSINLLTLGWTIRWGRECKVQILYYCRNVHQANPDAPVDESTTRSKDDEVDEACSNLTRRDPDLCESKWERFSHRYQRANLSEIYCWFPRDERWSLELKTWEWNAEWPTPFGPRSLRVRVEEVCS